jgi:hypothetical protein
MRYVVRSLKYFALLCVLYLILLWYKSLDAAYDGIPFMDILKAQLFSQYGAMLVAAFVGLSALYPRFGFMRRRIENCDMEREMIRINNAMQLYGFEFVGQEDGCAIYRAQGIIKRLTLMFEDEIRVYQSDNGIEIVGIRRAVARIAYQLEAYLASRRFEDNE